MSQNLDQHLSGIISIQNVCKGQIKNTCIYLLVKPRIFQGFWNSLFMHLKGDIAFQNAYKTIFLPDFFFLKYVCPPSQTFSDPLPETNYFFYLEKGYPQSDDKTPHQQAKR